MAQTKLQAIGLRHEYYQPRTGGRLLALDQVNLEVHDGEFVTIVGPSGCGKTTFINLCDGLLKPTAGQIIIDGKPVFACWIEIDEITCAALGVDCPRTTTPS